jgi:uncharacterized protein (DUF1800 family)
MTKPFNKINYLYHRAGFGLTPVEWRERKDWDLSQTIQHLFVQAEQSKGNRLGKVPKVPDKEVVKAMSKTEKKELKKKAKVAQIQQIHDWMARMADPFESCLLEKMTLFWHGHFACVIKGQPHLSHQYLNTIRKHALGDFRDLLIAISRDPAMIRFLNNQQNRKRQPNENFARELMELFTIGRGNYTENDVKEAARAFTGWSSTFSGEYIFRSRQHDYGQKTFMGKTGNFDGEDIIDILLEKRETANFIASKIYRYFVNNQLDRRRVEELAQHFYDSNYNISGLLRYMFTQDWFYAEENRGAKIKSPMELAVGIMRIFQVKLNTPLTSVFIQKALGQLLFHPPNVAGWPGGRAWIDHSTLMLRLNFTGYLFQATDVSFRVKEDLKARQRNRTVRKIEAEIDLQPLIQTFTRYAAKELPEQLKQYLLVVAPKISEEVFAPFIIQRNKEDLIKTLVLRLTSLPEYQVC